MTYTTVGEGFEALGSDNGGAGGDESKGGLHLGGWDSDGWMDGGLIDKCSGKSELTGLEVVGE